MKHRVDVRGVLIPNDYKWFYDFWGEDSTCPRDIQKVLDTAQPGDEIEVYINSGGGVIDVGSEIYTMLRGRDGVKIYITGEACSAASVVAMAGYCVMSPTALMMVHCVSSGQVGNHSDMEHMAEVLRTADQALCTAYMDKSGMSREKVLEMMERETWLTAGQAKEKGLIDAVMFEKQEEKPMPLTAGPIFVLPSRGMLDKARRMMKEEAEKTEDSVFLLRQKLNFLRLRGREDERRKNGQRAV